MEGQPEPLPERWTRPGKWRGRIAYGLLMVGSLVLFLVIRNFGETLAAPMAPPSIGVGPGQGNAGGTVVWHVLLALAAVVATGLVLGRLFSQLGQPPVIGEVLAGILLGPSLLGRIAPAAADYLLPSSVAPFLEVIAQLGVILYMFLVGLELNPGLLRDRAQAMIATAHASIVFPFLGGAVLALWLYPQLSNHDVPFTCFALFLGVAMSITAFPVLARILTDRGMHKTSLGVMTLTCAALGDVTAWCLLAFVVGVAQARIEQALVVTLLAVAYIGFMFLVVRPFLDIPLSGREETHLSRREIGLVFVLVLLSALATEAIGIHAIFGAFLLGVIIPDDRAIARTFTSKLEDLVTVLLLPAFFALTGMRTRISLISGVEQWLICGVIILVATACKFGGTALPARITGLSWRDASALGILMNTRGLMELIVLNIGLDLQVISPTLFAMMVVMALVTTLATTPILQFLVSTQPADAGDIKLTSATS